MAILVNIYQPYQISDRFKLLNVTIIDGAESAPLPITPLELWYTMYHMHIAKSASTGSVSKGSCQTIIMILAAGAINLAVTWTRNMREFALVGVWGLTAVAVSNWGDVPIIAYTALAVAILLLISSGIHGFRNRKSFPLS